MAGMSRRHWARTAASSMAIEAPWAVDGDAAWAASPMTVIASLCHVVVVTTLDQDDYVHRALRDGACGFLLKDASPALLVEAVRAAHRGDALLSPEVTVRLLRQLEDGRGPSSASGQPPRTALTERELAVARLVAVGRTNQEICAELFVSLGTVKTHLAKIQSGLGVRNRVEIAAWAWATGAVSQGSGPQS